MNDIDLIEFSWEETVNGISIFIKMLYIKLKVLIFLNIILI